MARSRSPQSSAPPKPRSDAYTGILVISLLLQITGVVFLYMDYSQYPTQAPTAAPKAQGPVAAAPAAPAAPVAPAPKAP